MSRETLFNTPTESLSRFMDDELTKDIAVLVAGGVSGVAGSLALAPFGFPGEEEAVKIRDRLLEWGCSDIRTFPTERYGEDVTQIDFNTPLPGDEPLASSMTVDQSNQVARAVVRFGVLEDAAFIQDPTNDPQQIRRLHDAIDTGGKPVGHLIYGHYGDGRRRPRPHLVYGWQPAAVDEMHIVENGDPSNRVDVFEFIDYAEVVGRRLRRVFRGDWDT
jgi:hypothetical protein